MRLQFLFGNTGFSVSFLSSSILELGCNVMFFYGIVHLQPLVRCQDSEVSSSLLVLQNLTIDAANRHTNCSF